MQTLSHMDHYTASTLLSLLCFLLFSCTIAIKTIETDKSALLAFQSHIKTDSNSTHLFSNWTGETSVCSWIGVECSSRHNRVSGLNISYWGLHGTIPPQIGNLSFLRVIDISGNNYNGHLPQEIAKLRRLEYIDFSLNNISGDIPGWFGSLPELTYLYMENNSLSGSLSSTFVNATKIKVLSIGSNQVNGYISEAIGNLRNLEFLNLEFNRLEGPLPYSFFNLSSLQVLGLSNNKLSGQLPFDICPKLPNIRKIHLAENQFSGSIQSRFDNCSMLEIVTLSINRFTGQIPREIGNLTNLVMIYCDRNQLHGEIPQALGNLANLERLSIAGNSLSGQIPTEIGNLQRLSVLDLSFNFLSGPIPPSLFNLSSLAWFLALTNNLTGSIPLKLGQQLPNLQQLSLAENRLTGVVPNSISNLTQLVSLQLQTNQLTGLIPTSLGNLKYLQLFSVYGNFLTADSSAKSGFLASLTNCRNLMQLLLYENPLNIQLLPNIGNFSSSLTLFQADSCGIRGNIPNEIGNLSGLLSLTLGNNNLTGLLPPSIQKLSNLQLLVLERNQLTGAIPNFLCNMKQLSLLYLGQNQLYGQVPECFGNMIFLTQLYLNNNGLNSTLPNELGNMKTLLYLDVSSNSLSGNISPTVGGLNAALLIDLSGNNFSGTIPSTIGGLGNLKSLFLYKNQLQGPIPETFRNLLSLETLDLSHNNLSGEIPMALEKLSQLKDLNVSFNHLRGRIPSNGSFFNFTSESFMSNDALCGGPSYLSFPPCIVASQTKGTSKKSLRIIAYVLTPTAAFVIIICGLLFAFIKKRRKHENLVQEDQLVHQSKIKRVSYYEIQRATNGFNGSNLLGIGSFGSVYKGVLSDGKIMAIKVFNQQREGAFRSFEKECEIISKIRHRNLLKVISSCSNLDFKALVLEFMPSGSLEMWLYSHNHFLNFLERLNIMIDVASGLDYLHNGFTSQIVHCDLKPSNILLDEQMVGRVSDFGISKLLGEDEIMVQTMTLATIGYTAPEYGSEGMVSTSCDVYSFGILLMEIFTRRKPTDDMFEDGWGLGEMIKEDLNNSTTDFVDQNLLTSEDKKPDIMLKCIVSMMELALNCAMKSPGQRTDVGRVLVELKKIKMIYLNSTQGKMR